jgi:hypothetical protein
MYIRVETYISCKHITMTNCEELSYACDINPEKDNMKQHETTCAAVSVLSSPNITTIKQTTTTSTQTYYNI